MFQDQISRQFTLDPSPSPNTSPSPSDPVVLKSLKLESPSGLSIVGSIDVSNIHFEKTLSLLLTLDNWNSQIVVYCEYDYAISAEVDRFYFKVAGIIESYSQVSTRARWIMSSPYATRLERRHTGKTMAVKTISFQ
jgi:hypothetical protein